MRAILFAIAFIFAAIWDVSALAQNPASGPWRGVWSKPGFEYQAQLAFTTQKADYVQGRFTWMLVQTPRAEEQAKIGMRGVEYVEGTFDAATGALTLRGTKLDDPNRILGTDSYRLIMSPDGRYIVGLTGAQGTWEGRIELKRYS
jgi:hypothetical protein